MTSCTNQCVICLETNQTTQIECITKDCNGMHIHNNCLEDFSRHFRKKCPFCQKDSLVYNESREIRINVNALTLITVPPRVTSTPSPMFRFCGIMCNYILLLAIGWGFSTLIFSVYCLMNTNCREKSLLLFTDPAVVLIKCFIGMLVLIGCSTCCISRGRRN